MCQLFLLLFMQYEDAQRQDEARKTVPVDKLEEKALLALARVRSLSWNTTYDLNMIYLLFLVFFEAVGQCCIDDQQNKK